jgi:hypothetical protein
MPLEEKKNSLPLVTGKSPLSQQFLFCHSGVVNLPVLIFQVLTILPAVQIVDKNIGIDKERFFSHTWCPCSS